MVATTMPTRFDLGQGRTWRQRAREAMEAYGER
jgi:hypothetical protein